MNNRIIKSLQSMRLFASFGVLQYHIWNNYLGVTIGHPGTDFFLVLVGTVAAITESRRFPEGNWVGYIKARYIRLYVTFIPIFLITIIFKSSELSLDWVLRSFFLIPIPDRYPVIGATWMLSFFLLFYFIVSIGIMFRRETVLLVIFGLWSVGTVAFVWLGWRPGIPETITSFLFSERNLNFVFGYLGGMLIRNKRVGLTPARWIFTLGLMGVIGGTILLYFTAGLHGRSLFLGIPVTLFVIGLASLEQNKSTDVITRFVTWDPMVWLGGISYVLFVSHSLFLNAWSLILPITPVLVPLVSIGAVIVAAVGYAYWEAPVLKYIKTKQLVFPHLPLLAPFRKQSSP